MLARGWGPRAEEEDPLGRGRPWSGGTGKSLKSGLGVGVGVRRKAKGTVKYVWEHCFLFGCDSHSVFKKWRLGISFIIRKKC